MWKHEGGGEVSDLSVVGIVLGWWTLGCIENHFLLVFGIKSFKLIKSCSYGPICTKGEICTAQKIGPQAQVLLQVIKHEFSFFFYKQRWRDGGRDIIFEVEKCTLQHKILSDKYLSRYLLFF